MKILKYADFSKEKVNFNIKGEFYFKSALGGILSILTAGLAIYFFNLFAEDMFNRQNPSLLTQSIVDLDNGEIRLNDPLFNMILQPYYHVGEDRRFTYDPTLFTLQVDLVTYATLKNGSKFTYITPQVLKVCDIDDFHKDHWDFYETNAFNSTLKGYCLKNKNVTVKGQYSSPVFSFLRMSVRTCDGIDFLTKEKVQCKSFDKIEESISAWKFSAYFTYAIAKIEDYLKPYSAQVFTVGYNFNPTVYAKDNYFFSDDKIITDDNWFVTGESKTDSYANFITTQTATATDSSKTSKNYLTLYVRVHTSYNSNKRIYKKIPDTLAQLLPIMHFIATLFDVILTYFHRTCIYSSIINYYFYNLLENETQIYKEIQKVKNQNKNTPHLQINLSSQVNQTEQAVITNFKKEFVEKSEYQVVQLNSQILHKKHASKKYSNLISKFSPEKIKMNAYLIFFCRKKNLKPIYDQLAEKLHLKMEIKSYLNNLEDVRKMKLLFMDKHQLDVFDIWENNYLLKGSTLETDWLSNNDKKDVTKVVASYQQLTEKKEKSRKEAILITNTL